MITRAVRVLAAAALVAGVAGWASSNASPAPNTTVRTDAGMVRGTENDAVHTFQGIPYARPPIGELRWQPPQPPPPWPGVRAATAPSAAPMAVSSRCAAMRRLVERGILDRQTAPSGKRQVYTLTATGRDLFTVIVALRQWGERHAFADDELHSVLVDGLGRPVPPLQPVDSTGNPTDAEVTRVVGSTG